MHERYVGSRIVSGSDVCMVVLLPADIPPALPGESGVENTILRPKDTVTDRWSVTSQLTNYLLVHTRLARTKLRGRLTGTPILSQLPDSIATRFLRLYQCLLWRKIQFDSYQKTSKKSEVEIQDGGLHT